MKKSSALRMSGFIGTAGLTVVLVGAAVSGTGAYFTDSEAGTITGTMGTINVVATTSTALEFANMLPGEMQSKSVSFKNDGSRNQDLWVVFKPVEVAAINTLGTYAEIHISAAGTPVFDSANLGYPALPTQILLASNVAPQAGSSMKFEAKPGLAFKNTTQGLTTGPLNYKIVATQVGIAPDNTNNDALVWP